MNKPKEARMAQANGTNAIKLTNLRLRDSAGGWHPFGDFYLGDL